MLDLAHLLRESQNDKRSRETAPLAGLVRGTIENLWQLQGEALKDWHLRREAQDSVVEMNTVVGKLSSGF